MAPLPFYHIYPQWLHLKLLPILPDASPKKDTDIARSSASIFFRSVLPQVGQRAAAKAANGGTVALDKLNKGFNWAALGATALNAVVNFGLSVLLSAAVSWISDYIHHVERAHQATAAYEKSVVTLSQLIQQLNIQT